MGEGIRKKPGQNKRNCRKIYPVRDGVVRVRSLRDLAGETAAGAGGRAVERRGGWDGVNEPRWVGGGMDGTTTLTPHTGPRYRPRDGVGFGGRSML